VPIDRAVTLRNAEKLIRQGKLADAILEFLRIVEDQPRDWNAKNTLGDLYARSGQIDKAIEQFIEIAEALNDEGAVAKAGAVYKKILKLKPDHERGLWQIADILGNQGLYADARSHLKTLIGLRQTKGDVRGVLQAKIRLGSLDPEDYEGRLTASSARIEMGDVGGAMRDFKEMAEELSGKGRQAEAIEVLKEAAKLDPDDDEIKEKLLEVHFATGQFAQARECATTIDQFRMIATALAGQGLADEALATLRQAATRHPADATLGAELARAFIARGDLTTAAEYLTVEAAGDDPALLMTVADLQLRGGNPDDGLAILRKLLEQDGSRRDQVALLGWSIAEQHPEAGFLVVELAAEAAVAQSDWPAAAAALQEFVTRVPNHIQALMHLVEICVDGGLEATMYSAQAQLADAYIAAGAATEARFIAEDLVAREPWEKANVERFRRALVLLGEPDPDALIAARLSGESPFMATDLSPDMDLPPYEPPPPAPAEPDPADFLTVDSDVMMESLHEESSNRPQRQSTRRESHQFELSANAIDLGSILGDIEDESPVRPSGSAENVEVDLSDDIKPGGGAAPVKKAAESEDLDAVFGNMRDQSKRSGLDDAQKEYKRGLALRDAGDIDGCIKSLEKASRAPKLRFATARLIARLYREREMLPEALEWLERASQAPAPTPDDGYQSLCELAEMLERIGEVARALAVYMELQSDAGTYRDVAERIDRLTKVQAGG
jgi:tetratricopeptide (TPR) repeat protein